MSFLKQNPTLVNHSVPGLVAASTSMAPAARRASLPTERPPSAMANPFLLDSQSDKAQEPVRMLIYGQAKTRKTLFALTAGATHRVTILDGENGTGISRVLPDAIRANIQRIPLTGKPMSSSMVMFIAAMAMRGRFIWDIAAEEIIEPAYIKPERYYIDVDISRLTLDDVVIVDSWTRITNDTGIEYMNKNKMDPFKGAKKERDFYGNQDLVLDKVSTALNALPCHLITIAHENLHTAEITTGGVKQSVTRQQILSSSGANAAKIPAAYSDVLWFEATPADYANALGETNIHTGAGINRVGGCREIDPGIHKFSKFKFKDYLEQAKIPTARTFERPYPDPFQFISGEDMLG